MKEKQTNIKRRNNSKYVVLQKLKTTYATIMMMRWLIRQWEFLTNISSSFDVRDSISMHI
jgi:hypothetical protein